MGQKRRMKELVIERYIDRENVGIVKDVDDRGLGVHEEEAWKIGVDKEKDMEEIDGVCQYCGRDETDLVRIEVWWGYKTFRCKRCGNKW